MYYSSIISIIYDVDGFCCQNWKIIINDPSTAPLGRECMFVCGLVSLSELKIGIQKIACGTENWNRNGIGAQMSPLCSKLM